MREERRREAFSRVEKQKLEEQRLLAVVNKWENVDRCTVCTLGLL